MTHDLTLLSNDELLKRRGELSYAAQMAALEGLPFDEDSANEGRALEAELARRGVDLSSEAATSERGHQR